MFFMLTRKQHSAIDRSKKLSKILAEEIQQIANDYKNNLTLRQIVEKYNIMLKYNIDNEEINCCFVGAVVFRGVFVLEVWPKNRYATH